MVSHFFIDRPVFAWVVAIAIMLAGLMTLRTLPVAQYPDIAPPIVRVGAMYPGASAAVVENSVTQVLEQELKGLEGLLYFNSTSSSSGETDIMLFFQHGQDAEVAQVMVQNKVNQVTYRLPQQVQQNGLSVTAMQNTFLMVAVFYDESGARSNSDIADWLSNSMLDALSRVPGVGRIQNFGSPYAMRIWLEPDKLASYSLMPQDVIATIEAQNAEVPVGELGALPAPDQQQLNVTVTALSRLRTVDEFRNLVLKTSTDGALVRLQDVARVEIGQESYGSISRLNGMPASGLAIMTTPGANSLATAAAVKERIEQLSRSFPHGVKVMYPEDATRFVKRSISAVFKTLAEAVALVVLVMFLFLQNWRTTLIPAITVPVVLLGTCAVLALGGFSINTLTLFGMVLAIGLLVDDAIVVVENAERIMQEEGVDALTATRRSMKEITSALIGVAVVLGAVFLPMAFFPGSVGVIYRQFSVTLVSAMGLSVLVALTLTPALCVSLLRTKQNAAPATGWSARLARAIGGLQTAYRQRLQAFLNRPRRFAVIYLLLGLGVYYGYQKLPTTFLPEDDQGTVMVRYMLPPGATYERTAEVMRQIEDYFLTREKNNTAAIYTVSGFSFSGSGQNAGIAFVNLRDWDERPGSDNTAQAIAGRATRILNEELRDGRMFAMVLPPVDGLGDSAGFEFWLQDTAAVGIEALTAKAHELVERISESPDVLFADAEGSDIIPQLRIDIDQPKAAAMGLRPADVNSTLSAAWGGAYVNDFIHHGRVKKVMVQSDAPFRAQPSDLGEWYVRGVNGSMTPFSAFASTRWTSGPAQLARFNGLPAIEISGAGEAGASSGDIMAMIEKAAASMTDTNLEWAGLSYQDKISGDQAPVLYVVSVLFVFLCLAALYESWSIPVAVMLVIPLGLLGAVAGVMLLGMKNDIFFQVGVLTTIGLAAKNAILIVEFAESEIARGEMPMAAVVHAASQRLRPILMTSLAFGAGIIPLVFATGPGAAAQNAIGASVLGGVISGTALAIFFVPLCYLLIARLRQRLSLSGTSGTSVAGELQPPCQ